MGIKNPKKINDDKIISFQSKYIDYTGLQLKQDSSLLLYINSINTNDDKINDSLKPFIQPLKAIYFDKNGYAESILVNCYAEFHAFNLDWNSSNRLSVFPPLTHTTNFIKLHYSALVSKEDLIKLEKINANRKVFIYWNFFLGRQSKIFLNNITKNLNLSTEPLNVIFINNDDWFYENSH
jgi:hypothetical protein